jgi:hypothetical protein
MRPSPHGPQPLADPTRAPKRRGDFSAQLVVTAAAVESEALGTKRPAHAANRRRAGRHVRAHAVAPCRRSARNRPAGGDVRSTPARSTAAATAEIGRAGVAARRGFSSGSMRAVLAGRSGPRVRPTQLEGTSPFVLLEAEGRRLAQAVAPPCSSAWITRTAGRAGSLLRPTTWSTACRAPARGAPQAASALGARGCATGAAFPPSAALPPIEPAANAGRLRGRGFAERRRHRRGAPCGRGVAREAGRTAPGARSRFGRRGQAPATTLRHRRAPRR